MTHTHINPHLLQLVAITSAPEKILEISLNAVSSAFKKKKTRTYMHN